MRPAEFTPESIIEAGQALQAAGRNITGFALRQRVGGGNPSRLKQVWDEYISAQAVAKAEPVAVAAPRARAGGVQRKWRRCMSIAPVMKVGAIRCR